MLHANAANTSLMLHCHYFAKAWVSKYESHDALPPLAKAWDSPRTQPRLTAHELQLNIHTVTSSYVHTMPAMLELGD